MNERSTRSPLGLLAVLCVVAGLLLDVQLVERTIVPDGELGTLSGRGALLALRLVLVGFGILLLARGHLPSPGPALALAAALLAAQVWSADRRHWVLDCSYGVGRCFERELHVVYGTEECWQALPGGCVGSRRKLSEVSFVADPTNFVAGPFSQERFSVEAIEARLSEPWDLEFTPDGAMLVTERKGMVRLIRDGATRTALELSPLMFSESGLLGLAVDPDFASNRHVYLYYTVGFDESDPKYAEARRHLRRVTNRISRFVLEDDVLVDEHVVMDAIPGSPMHCGGRLEFGPDGKLYATTGDAHVRARALDPSFLGGKILRLNPDGSVPDDNPLPGSPVYSLGHRNPQGLAWDPVTGRLFETENGPDRFDELNRVEPGGNYGWGALKCDEPMPAGPAGEAIDAELADAIPPVECYERYTLAPSGMTFVADRDSAWFGDLFVAGMRGRHLRRYRVADGRVDAGEIFFVSETREGHNYGIGLRLRDVEYHEGSLYVIGDQYGMVRLTPDPEQPRRGDHYVSARPIRKDPLVRRLERLLGWRG